MIAQYAITCKWDAGGDVDSQCSLFVLPAFLPFCDTNHTGKQRSLDVIRTITVYLLLALTLIVTISRVVIYTCYCTTYVGCIINISPRTYTP